MSVKYLKLIRLSFVNRLDYRQELYMSLLIGIIIFAGQTLFWRAVYDGRDEINGFTFSDILTYYLLLRIAAEFIDTKLGFRMTEAVIDGKISNVLIKPLKIKPWLFAEEFGRMLVDVFIKIIFYVILFVFVLGPIEIVVGNIPAFIISISLAIIISYNVFFLTGTLSFWLGKLGGINYAVRRLIMFLAGGLVPLAFFPEGFKAVLNWTPFIYMFDLPVRLLRESVSMGEMAQGLGVQLVWAILMWVLTDAVLKWAIKSNESVGI